jgi:15-cis-phytoene synthase
MQDAFDYCAALVRAADLDRFIATLFAPAERRGALHALYAFNVEVARVRDVAREPLPGEIRLQWWSDVVNGERDGEADANPVASALLSSMRAHQLWPQMLIDLIGARRFDLYDDPMVGLGDLENYARQTSSSLIALAARILSSTRGSVGCETAAASAGIASGIAGILRAFSVHVARGQLYVPVDTLERHGVRLSDVFAGRSSPGLEGALAELRNHARRHLATAGEQIKVVPGEALPAFLPVALVRPSLDRLEHTSSFAAKEISPWRRQWLIWRAARNPVLIAG